MTGQPSSPFAAPFIYAMVFIAGGVLMGFEMLGSRYLFPYFGAGIDIWASLISMVLGALAAGYFAGGAMVDRHVEKHAIILLPVGLAACYMALVPAAADAVLPGVIGIFGDGAAGGLAAAALLLLVPLSLLGTLSPVAIRLLTATASDSGRVAGRVYGISTLGSVTGTLGTTFLLMPSLGSRAITYCFALTLIICAAALFLGSRRGSR